MPRDYWFEDFADGQTFTTRGATLSEAQILDFALHYDPQPFHLDVEAAARSPYGGLIASGFQTMLIAFRLWYAERVISAASIGSPGMDEVRWTAPVRPGDTLSVRASVLETRPSRSRPDRGSVLFLYEVANQRGETVMTFRVTQLMLKRPAEADT